MKRPSHRGGLFARDGAIETTMRECALDLVRHQIHYDRVDALSLSPPAWRRDYQPVKRTNLSQSLTLGSIAKSVGGRLSAAASKDTKVKDFHVRAWSCGRGSVFLPIFRAGPEMTSRAMSRGAVGVMVDTFLPDDVPHIWVPDLQKAAAKFAAENRQNFLGKVVGITGSAGKSSTKTMLAQVLESQAKTYATRNNQNLLPYVTASFCSLDPSVRYAILELALQTPDMVAKSSSIAKPHVGIITSIGMNHAQFHENPREGILLSKTEMFWSMEANSTAILPSHDDTFDRLSARARESGRVSDIITCGYQSADDVRLIDIVESGVHSNVTISAFGKEYRYQLAIPGLHMVMNSLLVAAALKVIGEPIQLVEGLKDYSPPRSSIRRFSATFSDKQIEVIDDAIISSPHQVRAILHIVALRGAAKRRVFVFGDMHALGDEAKALHEELAPEIEAAGFDFFLGVGPNAAHLARKLSIPNVVYESVFEATKQVAGHLEDQDLVVFKASGPSNFKHMLKSLNKQAKFKRAPISWMIEKQ